MKIRVQQKNKREIIFSLFYISSDKLIGQWSDHSIAVWWWMDWIWDNTLDDTRK